MSGAVLTAARTCKACGGSLEGQRRDARYCSAACRREASRLRRLAAGLPDQRYPDLDAYLSRQRRAHRASGPAERHRCDHPLPFQRGGDPWRCGACGEAIAAPFEVPA